MVICKTMNFRLFISVFLLTLLSVPLIAQSRKTDANIFGHVVSRGEHVPFATISLRGTTIGVATDESGHYRIVNLPEGQYRVVAQFVGYKPSEKTIELKAGVSLS